MSTKETNESGTTSIAAADQCRPGTHWDEASQSCVPNSGGQDVSAFAENLEAVSDESTAKD